MIGIGIPRSQSRMGIATSSLTEMNADGGRKLQRWCGPSPGVAACPAPARRHLESRPHFTVGAVTEPRNDRHSASTRASVNSAS
jgi:hypothetical protein